MMHPSANGPQVFQQAEMADASKQNDEADVEEVHIPPAPAATGKGKSNKVVTRIKLSNFNPDEDLNVVKSWLEINCAPIISNVGFALKKDRVWDRIMHRYNLRRGSYPERSVRSLQSRWDTIKAEVKMFSSFYADAIRENPGMSDADKTTHAAANFAGILKHNFAYIHCWEIMKDEPKWHDPKPRPFAKSAGGEGFGEDSSHRPDTNDFGEHNSSPTGHAEEWPMGWDFAEMADASKQNDEADVEEVHIPPAPAATGKGKSNKVVTRTKLTNFKPDEDVNLVKSWLEISCDPVTSTAQKKDRVWDRIMHRYNLRRGSYPERSVRSLQSRWDTIKAEVKKFSSFYADAIRENPSGMSDADKTTHAAANFAVILKQNFAYIHCWEIMKDEPKWQDPKLRPFAKSAGGEGFGEDSRHGPDTNDFGEHNSSPTGHAEEWPMGLDFAEMADASKQNDEADVEEVHIPPAPAATGKGKSNKVVTRTKLSNFKPDEDVNIVKSWLEINCDPITSTAPKKHRMWDRIMHRYNLRRGSYPERSLKSLQNRWDIIKAEVGKFSSFYADAIRENPSGMPDADKTTHAAANFAGTLKRYFAYMHCWEIMKDEPKWQDPKPRPFAKSAGGEGFGEDSSNGPDTNVAMMHPSANGPQVFQQAEMADASKQKDEADVEEVHILPAPAATGEGKSNKVVTRTKLSNFNPDEDVNIVKSWLEISCDPITSTAQKEDRVWDRIMHRYNLRRGSYPERSLRSLQSRWDIIKAEVRQFSFLYADAIRENPSGMSDADKTTHAAANFASILKHNFAYMHCWEIMKDEPKWQDPKPRPFAKSAGGEGFGEDSSHGPDTNDLGEHNSSPTGHAEKRPMSRDSAKVAKKTKNSSAGSTSSAEYASRMQDVPLQKNSILQEESARKNDRFQQLACVDEKWFEEMRRHNQSLLDIEQGKIHIEQEKVRMMREKHDMDRQEKEKREDERILGIDLNACTPAQRMYYEALQEEIFEKIAARRRKRQGP